MGDQIETIVLALAIIFFGWILVSIVVWSYHNGISPMPTSSKAKKSLIRALPPIGQGKIYELGSGWGTLAMPLAKKYPASQVIGYETSPVPYLISKVRKAFSHCDNLQLVYHDFFDVNLGEASLVVCYLYPGAMRRLKDKFQKELKPGTLVISNTFAIPGWQPKAVYEVEDLYHTKIYLYEFNSQAEA